MPAMQSHSELLNYLRQRGLISGNSTRFTSLAGGVSSDILLVEDGHNRLVLKRSLEKLRVEDDWRCSTARNITECEAIRYASQLFPENVPRILYADPEQRLFVMEYFGSEFIPWKTQLLTGSIDLRIGEKMGALLGELHSASWLSLDLRRRFNTGADFFALRVEPYLLTTGSRHRELRSLFQEEADRIQQTSLALVHGDWSAKNFLVSAQRVIVLDWEVAWFGDPAFDVAFFLNLIYLKSLLNHEIIQRYLDLMHVFRATYGGWVYQFDAELDQRILRLTLMLMLARIDGKSRAEYLTADADKDRVRAFTRQALLDGVESWPEVDARWQQVVQSP